MLFTNAKNEKIEVREEVLEEMIEMVQEDANDGKPTKNIGLIVIIATIEGKKFLANDLGDDEACEDLLALRQAKKEIAKYIEANA